MELLRQRADQLGARFEPAHVELSLRVEAPELYTEVIGGNAELSAALELLERELLIPPSVIASSEYIYRLTNHNRSYCIAAAAQGDPYRAPAIVLKGVEPLMSDFDAYVRWLSIAPFRQSELPMAEHFPLAEGKVPGALTLREAQREAATALAFHRLHWKTYGELARVPLPLFVYRLDSAPDAVWRSSLRRYLSTPAFDHIEPLLDEGLGVFAYYYPAVPVRADHVGGDKRLTEYIRAQSSERAIASWIDLLARMMLLGYLPMTPLTERLGACMDPGNATLDGGFCDLDSLVPLAECPDDEFFLASLIMGLEQLRDTCLRVLSPSMGVVSARIYPANDEFVVTQFLARELARALEAQARPGAQADPRFAKCLQPSDLATLSKLLERRPRPRTFKAFTLPVTHEPRS